jgi:hypothetical protein
MRLAVQSPSFRAVDLMRRELLPISESMKQELERAFQQVASPDGRYIAGVFRRDGGVLTSGETRHVNLRRGSELFPRSIRGTLDEGLVYLTDKESWGLPIELRWQDAKHLVISAPFGDVHETHWQDVSIHYEALLPWVKLPWVKE